jgi:DNA-binding CsgD family transcriptional regulator
MLQDEISAALFISPKTVATHIQRILAKLGVHSRAEAVALAHRSGLVADVDGHEMTVASDAGSV